MKTDSTMDNLIKPAELAAILAISKPNLYRFIDKRIIPFYKIGGSLRFKKSDIDQYLESVRVESIRGNI